MEKQPNSNEAEGDAALDRLLFRDWDPIGVFPNENVSDEYHSYLDAFWGLVKSYAPIEEIADFLKDVETRSMGGDYTGDSCREDVARKAVALVAAWDMPARRED